MENPVRRTQIGNSAIHVIASEGCRGLTHRAVDRHAGLPIGTTINYHRTREDLLVAAAKHLMAGTRERLPRDPHTFFTELIGRALGPSRVQYLVAFELLLEGVRRPRLRDVMTGLYANEVRAIAEHIGGEIAALHLVLAAVYGLIHAALTGVPDLSAADIAEGVWAVAEHAGNERT